MATTTTTTRTKWQEGQGIILITISKQQQNKIDQFGSGGKPNITFSLYTFQEKDTHQLNVQKQGVIKLRSPILLDVSNY